MFLNLYISFKLKFYFTGFEISELSYDIPMYLNGNIIIFFFPAVFTKFRWTYTYYAQNQLHFFLTKTTSPDLHNCPLNNLGHDKISIVSPINMGLVTRVHEKKPISQ